MTDKANDKTEGKRGGFEIEVNKGSKILVSPEAEALAVIAAFC
jgi:hypothetical protein